MKKIIYIYFSLFIFNSCFAQSFLNGSFEINTALTCDYNLSNASFTSKVANTVAFGGAAELDIYQSSCGYGTAQCGNWMVGLAIPGGVPDAFTMMLNAPLVAGTSYTISFYDQGDPTYPPGVPIQIGLSTVPGALGTILYTGPVPTLGVWNNRVFSFIAPNNGQYISVSTVGTSRWTHVDNFSFVTSSTSSLSISPSSTICLGSSSTLTVSGGSTYTWSPSSSLSSSTGSNVIASPTITTTYTVLSSVASCSSTSTASAVITVNVTSPSTLVVSPSSTICSGQSATLTASGASSYTWSPSSSLSLSTGSNVVASPTITTTYTVIGGAGTCTTSALITVNVGSTSALVISPNSTICAGESATLTVSGGTTYTWSPGASLSSTSSSTVIATPTSNTTYTVISGIGTCSTSAITSVNVLASPTLAISPNSGICSGSSSTLIVTGASSYTWSPSSTLSSSSSSLVVASPTITTTYTVVGGVSTCTSNAITTVSVNTLPVINAIASPSTICSSKNSTLTASGTSTYTWSPTASLSASTGSITIANPNSAAVYSVTGTSSFGCVSSSTLLVDVIPTPTVNITALGSLTICAGTSTTLQASGAAGYLWSPSGSLTSSSGTIVVAAPTVSTLYTLIGTNGTCTDSKNVQVIVIPVIVPKISPHDTAICLGKSIKLTASGGNTYLWSPSSTLSSSVAATVIAKPVTTTSYSVIVSNNNICPQSTSILITVNPLPYVYAGKDSTINIDESITLIGAGDGVFGYKPLNGEALLCNYCSSVTVNPKENTCYLLHSINNFGCENTDEVCITVTKDYGIYIPNAFSPNGDVDNELFYPQGYGIASYDMAIYDRWGSLLFKSNADHTAWDGKMKGRVVEQGVYIYKIIIKTMGYKEIVKTGHVTVLSKVK